MNILKASSFVHRSSSVLTQPLFQTNWCCHTEGTILGLAIRLIKIQAVLLLSITMG
jgi:hypothetical protein